MSKSRHVSRKPLYLILALSLTLAIAYSVWNVYFRPTPVNIMAIAPASLTFGNTTISGTIQKTTPIDQPGTYFLTLPDMRVVLLYNVSGLNEIVGRPASISGFLTQSSSTSYPLGMSVKTITVEK